MDTSTTRSSSPRDFTPSSSITVQNGQATASVSAGFGGLAHALLVDRAGALLHPHVGAAGAAAEGPLLAALHLDRRAHGLDDRTRVGAHVVVPGEVAGVVVGDRLPVPRRGLEAPVAHQRGGELGVVHDLVVAADVRVLVADRVEAVR